jgi:hypothetical protein
MSSEVTELIAALRDGSMSLDEVAARFRRRDWPRRETPPPATYLELAAAAQQDPEPYEPGSFDDVVAAYDQGIISDDEYEVLAAAAAESKRAQDLRKSAGSAGPS